MTCENIITSCTSCYPDRGAPFFFHNNCTEACPAEISVEVDGQCIECDSTCKTCEGTPTNCVTCEPHMKFDPLKGTCEQLCESETQIFVPNEADPEAAGECQNCNPTCKKCAGTTETCTTCTADLLLNTDMTCQNTCNSLG